MQMKKKKKTCKFKIAKLIMSIIQIRLGKFSNLFIEKNKTNINK